MLGKTQRKRCLKDNRSTWRQKTPYWKVFSDRHFNRDVKVVIVPDDEIVQGIWKHDAERIVSLDTEGQPCELLQVCVRLPPGRNYQFAVYVARKRYQLSPLIDAEGVTVITWSPEKVLGPNVHQIDAQSLSTKKSLADVASDIEGLELYKPRDVPGLARRFYQKFTNRYLDHEHVAYAAGDAYYTLVAYENMRVRNY